MTTSKQLPGNLVLNLGRPAKTAGIAFGDSNTKANTAGVDGIFYGDFLNAIDSSIELVKRGVPGRTFADAVAAFEDEVGGAGCGPNLVLNSEFYSDAEGVQPADWTEHDPGGVATAETWTFNTRYLKLLNSDSSQARVYSTLTAETGKDYVFSVRKLPVASSTSLGFFVGSVVTGTGFDDTVTAQSFIAGFHSVVGTASATTLYYQLYGNLTLNAFTAFTDVEVREDIAPEFVYINLGTNDIVLGETAADMIINRDALIASIKALGAIPIIATIPPYDAATGAQQDEMDEYNADTLASDEITIPLYTALEDPASPTNMHPLLGDGTHKSQAGHDREAHLLNDAVGKIDQSISLVIN